MDQHLSVADVFMQSKSLRHLPGRCVGPSIQEETPGQSEDTLERLYLSWFGNDSLSKRSLTRRGDERLDLHALDLLSQCVQEASGRTSAAPTPGKPAGR